MSLQSSQRNNVRVIEISGRSLRLNHEISQPSRLFQNTAIQQGRRNGSIGSKVYWFKSRPRSARVESCVEVTRKPNTPIRKHYIPAPFGVILKGHKLKQRNDIGGIFRESVESCRSIVFRNEFNMRSKWK